MVFAAEVMMSSVQVRPKAKFIVADGNFARFWLLSLYGPWPYGPMALAL